MNQSANTTSGGVPLSNLEKLKQYIFDLVSPQLANIPPSSDRKQVVTNLINTAYDGTKLNLPLPTKEHLFTDLLDEFLGFDVIQPLLNDTTITEVMVNGMNKVFIERNGIITKTNITFTSDDQILKLINKIIQPLGRRVDGDSPMVDARLPDGSRVNAIIPPVSIDGPSVTIRKFQKGKLQINQLIELGSLTRSMAELFRACVVSKLNIIISGGTGSGKTTLLNALSSFIPENERIVTIEDTAEMVLQQDHVVRLETKADNPDGHGGVTVRELVRNSLRMRPDRIVIGEVRSGEAMDMLQALNTGHDGSLTTLHANSPRDALSRLETMCLMSGLDIPLKVVRQQVASAIDLVIQISRERDGSRKIVSVTEVVGMEADTIVLTDIFKYERTGVTSEGKVLGEMKPTGIRPQFSIRLEANGFKLGPSIFGGTAEGMLSSRNRR